MKKRQFAKKMIVLFLAASIIPLCLLSMIFYLINVTSSRKKILDAVQLTARHITGQVEERFVQMQRVADTIENYMYGLPRDKSPTAPEVLDAYSTLRTSVSSLISTFDFSHVCFFLQEDKLYKNEGLMFYSLEQLDQFHISAATLKEAGERTVWNYLPSQNYPFMVSRTYDSFSEIACVRAQQNSVINTLNYVFFISINVKELQELFKNTYESGSGISACLTTPNGIVIASSNADCFSDQEILDEKLLDAVNREDHLWETPNKVYYFQILNDGWIYVTCIERNYIRSNTLTYIYMLLLILAVTVPLVSQLIVYLTKNMTHRIKLLSESVNQVNFDQNHFHAVKIDYVQDISREDYDEIDQLADTYNKMVNLLYENVDHITELKAREQTLKYRLLQSLINPHFLYNILDSIATCNRIGKPELANKMIMNLTRFYRMTLKKSNELITIRDEIEIATLYMELESICRGGNFTWEIEMDEEIENFMICKFTLQPFLENSIRHGMQGMNRHLHIRIEIRYTEDNIRILIHDNGLGISEEKLRELQHSLAVGEVDTARHFGICNVNARISSELFGHGFIEIDSEYAKGTDVKIEFQQILPD